MATQPKTPPRRAVTTAGATARKPKAAPARSGENYVHFSDKIVGALNNISDVIEDNKGTLDSIQDMALQLTRTISLLREVVVKYVDMVENVLEVLIPIMDKIPLIPDKIIDFAKDAHELAGKIMKANDLAVKVLPGVEQSLLTADVAALQASTKDVAGLTKALQEINPTPKK